MGPRNQKTPGSFSLHRAPVEAIFVQSPPISLLVTQKVCSEIGRQRGNTLVPGHFFNMVIFAGLPHGLGASWTFSSIYAVFGLLFRFGGMRIAMNHKSMPPNQPNDAYLRGLYPG